jgi:hypothetical protein
VGMVVMVAMVVVVVAVHAFRAPWVGWVAYRLRLQRYLCYRRGMVSVQSAE